MRKIMLIGFVIGCSIVGIFSQATIIIQTDKPFYASGETVHFKIFNPSSQVSAVTNIELVDEEGSVVQSCLLKGSGRIAFGTMNLSLEMETGWYSFRSYTLWTPSMGVKDFGYVTLPIYNTFDQKDADIISDSPPLIVDDQEIIVSISTANNVYSRRARMTADIAVADRSGSGISSNLAISVFEARLEPYFEVLNKHVTDAGPWVDPPQEGDMAIDNLSYFGRLQSSPKNVLLGLYKVRDGEIVWTFLDENDHFIVPLDDFTGTQNAQMIGMEPLGGVQYFEPVERKPQFQQAIEMDRVVPMPPIVVDYLNDRRDRMIIDEIFRGKQERSAKKSGFRLPFKADKVYRVDDYIRFTSVEEFIDEVVNSVRVRKEEESLSFRVLLENKAYAFHPPLMFLNGYMVTDARELLDIDINDLEQVELFRKDKTILEYFGSVGRNGVVSFYTKDGIQRPLSGSQLLISGFTSTQPEMRPSADFEDLSKPVLSPLLYWNASVNTNSDGKVSISCSTSDDTGEYVIYIRGISDKGSVFSKSKRIVIRANEE